MKKNIANICSLCNAMCGLVVILMLSCYYDHYFINIGCIFILFGVFFDSIDGMLARKLNIASELGKQLDSFADVITFGIAPIMIFLSLDRNSHSFHLNIFKITFGVLYIISAIYRLAKFNVSNETSFFTGLPTTAAGLILSMTILLANNNCMIYNRKGFCFLDAVVIVLACLMNLNFKIKKVTFSKK